MRAVISVSELLETAVEPAEDRKKPMVIAMRLWYNRLQQAGGAITGLIEILEGVCMGALDTVGKQYFSDNTRFADAFNYLIYDGKPVIKADELKELDTTQIAIPYGNGASLPLQKYRDLLKLWAAKMDDGMIYVMLGGELQGSVHYGMPVKDMVYDSIGYSKQIEEARHSYKNQGNDKEAGAADEGDLVIGDDTLKIKLTSEEFLSGFRKEDKLIPIVTAVIYMGSKSWDGPKSLHDMMNFKDDRLKQFVPNYWINLISPVDMEEADIDKFKSNLNLVMRVLKHQNEDADKIIEATNHNKIDGDTARFLNVAANLKLEIDEKAGEVDMCMAMEKRDQRMKINGAIEAYRDDGKTDEDIISKIIKKYKVTREYVLAILNPQPQEAQN